MKETSHHFYHILFIRSKSLEAAHIQGVGLRKSMNTGRCGHAQDDRGQDWDMILPLSDYSICVANASCHTHTHTHTHPTHRYPPTHTTHTHMHTHHTDPAHTTYMRLHTRTHAHARTHALHCWEETEDSGGKTMITENWGSGAASKITLGPKVQLWAKLVLFQMKF